MVLNLAVDMGNSAIKYALFNGNAFLQAGQVTDEKALAEKTELQGLVNVMVSSVRESESALPELLSYSGTFNRLTYQTPVPVQSLYETPETLGMDRLAAVVGANYLFPDFNCLVIDAGTCITCDFVDAEKVYHGGSISPGLQMKFKAMHTFTGKLPLVEQAEEIVPLSGKNTRDAMRSGVLNGTIAELNGFIQLYKRNTSDLAVVLCGGDAAFFETNLKATIFVVPELVLIGLNRILNYNA